MTEYIENIPFDEIRVGDSASLEHTLKKEDIGLFAALSGDVNPAHMDKEYAQSDMFHHIVAHGMWSGAFFSTLLGTQLPGPGTIYLNQTLQFKHPVLIGDTIKALITVVQKTEKDHSVEFNCECINQTGQQVVTGKAIVIAPKDKIKRERIEPPTVFIKPEKQSLYKRIIDSKADYEPLVTAIVHPVDDASLRGAIASAEDKLIIPILVGPADKIKAAAKAGNIDLNDYEIVATRHSTEAAEKAVELAKEGKVEAIMKGKLHTEELLEAVLDKVKGLRTGRRMSHVFAMEVPYYPKPLFLTDAAINIMPNLSTKKDIVQNAIDLFRALNLGTPKVAIVSAVETVNEKIPSTLDATALCKMAERGQITGGILDGPLALDLAISEESAKVKGIQSLVAGDADIIVVPDVESGNMLYKQMTYLSKVEAAGVVLGARVPIILTSRGSDEASRKASCAMALVYARHTLII